MYTNRKHQRIDDSANIHECDIPCNMHLLTLLQVHILLSDNL